MTKVMLVEDDNNLREIYQARLAAEGYDLVAAKDGEEALALAVKEKPDLIVCDVMMPKVSGFEMLDILRGTTGIKDTKVIMMTALSQAEDKERAEKLGADRYLVKSQVTLEDMAKSVKDVLEGSGDINNPNPAPDSTQPPTDNPPTTPTPTPNDTTAPAAPPTAPADPVAVTAAPAPPEPESDESAQALLANAADKLSGEDKPAEPTTQIKKSSASLDDRPDHAEESETSDGVTIARKKVIQPLSDLSKPEKDLDALLAKEDAKEQLENPPAPEPIKAIVDGDKDESNSSKPSDPLAGADEEADPDPHVPGQVINPQGGDHPDPSSIAL